MDHLSLTDLVTIIGNVAITLSLVVALAFGIAQVRAAARDRRERLTLETLRNFQTPEFAGFIYQVNNGRIPVTYAELRALGSGEQIQFIQFAQEMESVGMLVSDGVLNLDLVEKTLGSFVTIAWDKYRPIFMDMRKETDDPFLAEYFQSLAELLEKRMRENPRQPAYLSGAALKPAGRTAENKKAAMTP